MRSISFGSLRVVDGRFMGATLIGTLIACSVQAAESTLEEVVVTAQKRTENVQDVPIAISVFSAAMLQEKGITDVTQLSNMAPNVTFDAGTPFSGSSSTLAAYIRGIGQNDFAFNLDPGVGVYLDGVYLARTVGANTDLGDVARIEVLKGPQGTLFGRNSIGGAISIVTREPGSEFTFKGDITAGRFDRHDFKASVDIPFSDAVRSAFSFSSKTRDGYVKRIPYSDPAFGTYVTDGNQFRLPDYRTTDLEGGQDEWTVRGKLLIEPADRVKVTVTGDYTGVDQSATPNTLLATPNLQILPFGPTAGNFAAIYNTCIGSTPGQLAAAIPAPFPPFTTNLATVCGVRGVAASPINPLGRAGVASPIGSVNVDADPYNNRLPYDSRFIPSDKDTSYATGLSLSKMQSYGGSATVAVNLTDSMEMKSITGYRQLHFTSGLDLDGSPMEMLELGFDMNQKQFSEESQLTGTAIDERLTYVVGAYYFEESGNLHDYVQFPAGLLQVDGDNLLSTRAWAAFTHLNFKLTDRLGITLGGRYTDEDKRFQGFQSDLNGFNYKVAGIPADALIGIPCNAAGPLPPTDMCDFATLVGFPDQSNVLRYHPPGVFARTFTDFSPRAGMEFHATDEVMLYASYSKGFKTGGWTTRYSNPVQVAQAEPGFQPEEANSYETGVKSQLLGRRLQLNASAFYTEYQDIQLNQQEGVSPTIRNAGDAEFYGFEVELQSILTGRLEIVASAGYNHAQYTRKAAGVAAGDSLPKTPEWKFNIGPRYELPLNNQGAVVFNADFTHTAELYNDTENTPELKRDAVNMLNASVSYQAPEERWYATAGVVNALNERYLVTGAANLASGQIYGTYNRPIEWFVTLGTQF
jgi:iron complex outermembrane receptor protein